MSENIDLNQEIYSKMSTFKAISSILSPADIQHFIGQKYAIHEVKNCRLLKAGINHTYRVDVSHESYIFRIYSFNWRTQEEINEELSILNLLKNNGISVSYPVADAQNKFIQSINAPEGERFAVLFSFAEGHKIQNYSKEIHFKIGEMMAKIHNLTHHLTVKRTTYDTEILLDNALNNIKKFLSDDVEELQYLTDIKPILENTIHNADTQNIRTGVVHLDIWFDNLNISDDDKITLFDFDFCGNGWLCLDIAYYLIQVFNTERVETERSEKSEYFLKGYESIQKLTDEERRLLPFLSVSLYFFYLGIQCARFDNWSNTFLNEVYLKRFIAFFIKGYFEYGVKQK